MLKRRSLLIIGGAALAAAGGLTLGRERLTPGVSQGPGPMTPPEALAAAASGAILLVDIRRPDEWAATGVAVDAVTIDMRDAAFLDRLKRARHSSGQPIAVICARGVRSARMTRRLTEAGIGPVIDIPEGMLGSFSGPGWLKRGLPVKTVP